VTETTERRTYSLQSIQEMLGLSRAVVIGYVKAGFIAPERGPRNAYLFDFQDVVLLRTAQDLRSARIPTRRIRGALDRLRGLLPSSVPLSGLRITAVGDDVVVREGGKQVAATSGQLLFDFEVAAQAGDIVAFPGRKIASSTVDEWIARGEALEPNDAERAIEAYRQAIVLEPSRSDGYLDLGAFLHGLGRNVDALKVYDDALVAIDDEPDLHFNRAIVLEDLDRPVEALAAYERCFALDPEHADAHWNAARLYEQQGVGQMALQHYSAFRRLQR
jgi:DNA-binding transcriptional MerR regulator